MFTKFKDLYRQRTPLEVITHELALAHLERLEAETAVDYAKSILDYNLARINRLNQHIANYPKGEKK